MRVVLELLMPGGEDADQLAFDALVRSRVVDEVLDRVGQLAVREGSCKGVRVTVYLKEEMTNRRCVSRTEERLAAVVDRCLQ